MSLIKSAFYAGGSAWARATKRHPVGRNIYQDDWDICIVLDSCRLDMLRDAISARPVDIDVGAAWSRGSITTEWLTQTFRPPHDAAIAETTLVTASPHSKTVFSDKEWLTNSESVAVPYPDNPAVGLDAFGAAHELWRTEAGEHGAVPPETMRDATIEAWRQSGGRVVAHWLQPHEPFIAPDAEIVGGSATETNVWDGLQSGRLDEGEVWESYRHNLNWSLMFVFDVLQAVDADVLITADHGNAMGEVGIWGHPFGYPQPAVRRVPWARVTATKERHFVTAGALPDTDTTGADVDEQLKALGYR